MEPLERVALLFIAFLKELAQPLFPQKLHQHILQFERKSNNQQS